MRHPDPAPIPAYEAMHKGRSAPHGLSLDRARLSCGRCRLRELRAEVRLNLKWQNRGGYDHRNSSMLSDPGFFFQAEDGIRDVRNGWKADKDVDCGLMARSLRTDCRALRSEIKGIAPKLGHIAF